MNELLGIVRSFGVARLGAIVGVTIGVAVALGLIILRIGEPPMSILYANLDMRDAQAVLERLEQEGVRHELRDRGGDLAIMAPRDQISRLKLSLTSDGVIAAPGIGYEIFDNNDTFGATTFQQNMSRLRALEGELSRTIASIDGVRAARVHLVLPERELFARDKKTASASIIVDASRRLDAPSVKAIINLAASAVPELSPDMITVLDASGALLAAAKGDNPGMAPGDSAEKTAMLESRIRRTVEDIIGRIVGEENLRVQVTAEIDFNRVTENSEIIDPDSQTVLSSTTVEESSDDVDPALSRGVTVANALPGAAPVTDPNTASTSTNRRTEETTNYEISRTVRQEVREVGGVKRLSVAVALNAGAAPRSDEELARITTLVRSAIGYDAARGDQVQVVEAPFALAQATLAGAAPIAAASDPSLSREQLMRLAEIAALSLIALALVFYVLRPMFRAPAVSAPSPVSELAGPAGAAEALPSPGGATLEEKLNLQRVEGQVKASSLKQVAEVVSGHTSESAGILKNWIREAS
ncbi:MAG: flagellar basal-body MS-ring/collar protein FliF [Pseudomonadota bacterium]